MGTIVGTPGYMAPEQMMSSTDVDARSDVWSMGAMLYELVTGLRPFAGDSELQVFANVMTKPPLPLPARLAPDIPEAAEVLLRCLRRAREERYPSISDLAGALRSAIA
jgi:serine/threonine-protein kinase